MFLKKQFVCILQHWSKWNRQSSAFVHFGAFRPRKRQRASCLSTRNIVSQFCITLITAYNVLITKNIKLEKISTIEKLTPQGPGGGTLGRSEVEKIFCRNFANKLSIRSLYGVLISKNTKLEKILTIEKLTPQGGKKFSVTIFKTNYIFGVHKGSSSQKTQRIIKLEKF